jgi:hypothetical protein
MAGNRRHGFLRGNANGRNGSSTPAPWHCAGCGRLHGGRVTRTGLAGHDYCDRTYLALKARQVAGQTT